MNSRRQLLIVIGATPFLSANAIRAQHTGKLQRIGYIGNAPIDRPGRYFTIFREELRRLGHIEGKTIAIDYKAFEGQLARISGLVQELIQTSVDVLVAPNLVSIHAAQKATTTIPIVMTTTVDPVAAGFAKSLRQPGGNITGISTLSGELSAKRVELLKDLVPGVSRIAVLWDVDGPGPKLRFQQYSSTAKLLKLSVHSLEVSAPVPDLEKAFQTARANKAQALLVIVNPFLGPHIKAITALSAKYNLPSIGESRIYAEVGGLASYGNDLDEQPKMLASIVSKVLRGASPANLPIEQPTKFELVVNMKTAKALGIKIPPPIMVRADKVIE